MLERLRLDFENSTSIIEGGVSTLYLPRVDAARNSKSLAIFLQRKVDGIREQSHCFVEIMQSISHTVLHIKHLQIHQFIPTVRL
jgi:hypothetical protein